MTLAPIACPSIASPLRLFARLATPFGIGLLLAHAACAPSDADRSVEGLIAPPSVSVLSADAAAVAAGVRKLSPSAFPADAEYFTDPVYENAFDLATDEITVVNDVLCLLGQARYGELVNQGVYLAQIETQRCDPGAGSVTQSGTTKSYEDWLVHSRRRADDEPQHVELWVPAMTDGGSQQQQTLYSELDVFAQASDLNPYGLFELNFAGTPPFGDPHAANFCGRLSTKPALAGRVGFEFFMLRGNLNTLPLPGEQAELTQVNVDLAGDQTSGVARVSKFKRRNDPQTGDTGILSKSFRLVFDGGTLVRQQDSGPVIALSRTNFKSCSRRMNLYVDDTRYGTLGERVKLKTGMGILLPGGHHAFVDYYGVHSNSDVVGQDGDLVQEDRPDGSTSATFTLRIAPGRLIECTRQTAPLSSVIGEWFDWTEPFVPNAPPPRRLRLAFDGVDFTAFEQFDFATGTWQPITPFVVLWSQIVVLHMGSKRYGGNCIAKFGNPDLGYYVERVASGDDAFFGTLQNVQLFGLLNCLRPQLTAAAVDAGDVFFPPAPDVTQSYSYQFSSVDRVLYYDDPVLGPLATTIAPGEFPGGGPFQGGMRSGPMVQDLSSLQVPENIFDEPIYWVWETGQNEWNLWSGLIDATGATVAFDAPIQFAYVHLQANDANDDPAFDGQSFLLEYRGDGQLFGIPWQQVDTDQDGNPDHDVPLFSIADGVTLGPQGFGYVVKTIERELLLQPDVNGPPPGLDPALADTLLLPDGGFYRTPEIGPVPLLDIAPAVVGGEIQGVRKR